MPIEKLSASKIASITKPGKYGDGGGLYLQVTKNLAKSWVFRYQINNTERYMGLGSYRVVSLGQARKLAHVARNTLADKLDPIEKRDTTATEREEFCAHSKTFDECAAEYISLHKNAWRSLSHQKQWESSLRTYASPYFGKTFVRDISTTQVLHALTPIWMTKTETASRLRERIERVLSWATISRYREGENPARWDGHLQELLPKPSRIKTIRHYPSMPYQEIGAFFRGLNAQEGVVARMLEFTILTACRTSEVLHASWKEINLTRGIWTIPAARMKNGREYRIPLANEALKILLSQQGQHPDLVFPNLEGEMPFCKTVMLDLLQKRMSRPDITVHGFRSSFRTWAAEKTAYPREIAEMALAHKQPSAVEEAYQRSDLFERRIALMQDWADWCAKICYQHLSIPDLKTIIVRNENSCEGLRL